MTDTLDTAKHKNVWINVTGPSGSLTFKGRELGETDSHQDAHGDHAGAFAARGERCYACRWSLYRIYEVYELDQRSRVAYGNRYDGRYLVCSFGMTIVPGEEVYRRMNATDSPSEVVELLTTRRYNRPPILTSAAARLLARVGDRDPDIQDAYDARAVL